MHCSPFNSETECCFQFVGLVLRLPADSYASPTTLNCLGTRSGLTLQFVSSVGSAFIVRHIVALCLVAHSYILARPLCTGGHTSHILLRKELSKKFLLFTTLSFYLVLQTQSVCSYHWYSLPERKRERETLESLMGILIGNRLLLEVFLQNQTEFGCVFLSVPNVRRSRHAP